MVNYYSNTPSIKIWAVSIPAHSVRTKPQNVHNTHQLDFSPGNYYRWVGGACLLARVGGSRLCLRVLVIGINLNLDFGPEPTWETAVTEGHHHHHCLLLVVLVLIVISAVIY